MKTVRLAWLLSRPSKGTPATAILPILAFGVVTTLLLIVLGGAVSFFSWSDELAVTYQGLAVIALALLIVPLLTLGGSAARLSARRRDDRLSTLRLLGATPALVTGLTVLESTALAVSGAIAGVLGYVLLVPLVGLISFRGDPLGGRLWLNPGVVVLVVLAVAVLAAVSAIVGLRGVIISPLGVRTRQSAPRIRWTGVIVGVAFILATVLAIKNLSLDWGIVVVFVVLIAGFGGTIAILNLIGPFVIGRLARRGARRAKTAQRLLAARSILESPKAAWRQVSGVSMTSFVAVFAGIGVAVVDASANGSDPDGAMLATDIRTGVIITLVASFLMVACSVGVNQASAILDRRELYVSLDRLGMPPSTMDAARTRAVMSPLRIVAIGSALVALVVVLPLTPIAILTRPLTLLVIAGCLVAGAALVWLGLRATRPVLTRVLAEPDRALG